MHKEFTRQVTLSAGATPTENITIAAEGLNFITFYMSLASGAPADKDITLSLKTGNFERDGVQELFGVPIEFVQGTPLSEDGTVYTFNTSSLEKLIFQPSVPILQELLLEITSEELTGEENIQLSIQYRRDDTNNSIMRESSESDPDNVALTTANIADIVAALHALPRQVEAVLTDGLGTAVSQSASIDYATITVWEVAAQGVTRNTTYESAGRDLLYLKDVCVTIQVNKVSTTNGCLYQESNNNSTWYTLAACTLAADTNTILYAGPRSRRYGRISYTENNVADAVLNSSISGSPQ